MSAHGQSSAYSRYSFVFRFDERFDDSAFLIVGDLAPEAAHGVADGFVTLVVVEVEAGEPEGVGFVPAGFHGRGFAVAGPQSCPEVVLGVFAAEDLYAVEPGDDGESAFAEMDLFPVVDEGDLAYLAGIGRGLGVLSAVVVHADDEDVVSRTDGGAVGKSDGLFHGRVGFSRP